MIWKKACRLFRVPVNCVVLVGVIITGGEQANAGSLPTLNPADSQTAVQVTVTIQKRQFLPSTIHVRVGQKVRLLLENLDAELHAFVPVGALARTSLQVSGNGAPQFGAEGLVRVLLPSSGISYILFVPRQAGTYPFFCDLPGHRMNGQIVVERGTDMVQ